MWNELARSLQSGNSYTLAILSLTFLALIIIFERLLMLHFVYNLNFEKFVSSLKNMVGSEDYERAMSFCKTTSYTSLPKISLAALEAAEYAPHKVAGTIEEECAAFLPKISARIPFLSSISTIILMLGVLGTVNELWSAFHSLGVLDTAKKQASLAEGISSSLNYIALGLCASILILGFTQIIRSSANRLLDRVNHGVVALNTLLVQSQTMISHSPTSSSPKPEEALLNEEAGAAPSSEESSEEGSDVEDIKDEEEII